MPRKFYALFFLPRSPLFYAMTPFLRIERKKKSPFFRYSPFFALSLQINLARRNPFANKIN